MASKMAMISSPDLTITMCGSSGFGTMSVAQMLPSRLSSAKSVYRLTASRTLSRALTFWKHELFVAVFVEHTPPFKQRQNLTLTQNLISTSEISTQGDQSPWTPCGGFAPATPALFRPERRPFRAEGWAGLRFSGGCCGCRSALGTGSEMGATVARILQFGPHAPAKIGPL